MSAALRRAFRYARGWVRDPQDLAVGERTLPVEGGPVPATLYAPAAPRSPLPAWIVLHGITRPGRFHPVLVRFARALASTGAAVLVPEVPEWVALSLAPHRTRPTVRAALDLLAEEPGVAPGPRGLVGFSFGAPQAIRVGGELRGEIGGAVAFGGYCDLERALRFQLTGVHEWQGRRYSLRPDPYGRWIVAGNYLTGVPGYSDAGAAAEALLELARLAGERRLPSWSPEYDPVKERLAATLGDDDRALFRVFAPPTASDPIADDPEAAVWAERLVRAGVAKDPLVDALAGLTTLPAQVHILHGRADVLIPWSEALRMAEALEGRGDVHTAVTGLFAHSDEHPVRDAVSSAVDGVRFFRTLARMLAVV